MIYIKNSYQFSDYNNSDLVSFSIDKGKEGESAALSIYSSKLKKNILIKKENFSFFEEAVLKHESIELKKNIQRNLKIILKDLSHEEELMYLFVVDFIEKIEASICNNEAYFHHEEQLKYLEGVLWKCVGVKENKNGGKIYRFELKEEYDYDAPGIESHTKITRQSSALTKIRQMEPAIEDVSSEGNIKLIRQKLKDLNKSENALGFQEFRTKEGKYYVELPDAEALMKNWEALDLGVPCKIATSEGIEDDLSFVLIHMDRRDEKGEWIQGSDAVLSSQKEFIHDHFNHVMAAVINKLILFQEGKKETFFRKFIEEKIKVYVEKLFYVNKIIESDPTSELAKRGAVEIEKIKLALGACVDLASALKENKPEEKEILIRNLNEGLYVFLQESYPFSNRSKEIFSDITPEFLKIESEKMENFLEECQKHVLILEDSLDENFFE